MGKQETFMPLSAFMLGRELVQQVEESEKDIVTSGYINITLPAINPLAEGRSWLYATVNFGGEWPGPMYLAGQISGDVAYYSKFMAAETELAKRGIVVANPARLQNIFPYEGMIRLSMAEMMECPIICMLPCWRNSDGAIGEFGRGYAAGKIIVRYEDVIELVPVQEPAKE